MGRELNLYNVGSGHQTRFSSNMYSIENYACNELNKKRKFSCSPIYLFISRTFLVTHFNLINKVSPSLSNFVWFASLRTI